MGDINAFRAAVSTLFKPQECAVSLFGYQYQDQQDQSWKFAGDGDILWLEDVIDPEKLDPFWTLSVPGWYHPEMGNLHVPNLGRDNGGGPRTHVQTVCLDKTGTVTEMDVYTDASPFLVFEMDNLLIEDKHKTTPEIKKLQRDAMAYAFQASGFPFAVLIDSGGKSVHATVRLEDDEATIRAWRQSPEFARLLDLAWVVFGSYDRAVLEQSGRSRLVRTPGAIRENGAPQTILAIGKRVSIKDLMAWFASQLNQETQQEVWSRQPVTIGDSPLRQRYLRLGKWRNDLMKPHQPGHRGEEWMHVSKTLMLAGCLEPHMEARPAPGMPYGVWRASWLWHVSAFVFNVYSNGWFFSTASEDWKAPGERTRWDGLSRRESSLREQLTFEKASDPQQNALVDQMLRSAQSMAQHAVAELPPPPSLGPPMHVPTSGQVFGAALQTDPNATPTALLPASSSGGGKFSWAVPVFFQKVPQAHFVKLSQARGDKWMLFNGTIWVDLPNDYARKYIADQVLPQGADAKLVGEVYQVILRECISNEPWEENPNAIAFLNGTLYVHPDRLEFKSTFSAADRLRSQVTCHYDPQATCPRWEAFVRWALPDTSRLSLLQEAFGYTLIPGQPYQSFFMLTGSGSNGKSVVLSVLQALHRDSFETVALANLGGRFSLGTISRKRLAIDTEAENVTNLVIGDGNSATAILKSWTGGDPVKIEAKAVQGWSETINAKYFMACNRKPRFADPTKGVWRRLKLLKFESHIDDRQADVNLPRTLITQELPGIVNWAVQGLVRLVSQNGFTKSELLSQDLLEYQTDSDSVAQFFTEFMRPAPEDGKEAWFDVRPFHEAYKQYAAQIAVPAVGESEFRQRLTIFGVHLGRPQEHEPVHKCPAGFERMPGQQYWAVRGWRCYHPAYTTQTLIGAYVQQPQPMAATRTA